MAGRVPADESAFTARLGAGQGRVRRRGEGQGEGEYAFLLGHDEPGWRFDLERGDYAEVRQEVDLTGAVLVRVALRLRVQAPMPAGLAWEASLWVGGVRQARAIAGPGRTRVLTDLAANVSKLRGTHAVAVRLELVGSR